MVTVYYDGDQSVNTLRCTLRKYDDFARKYQAWHYFDRLYIKEPVKTSLFTDFAALPYQQSWGLAPLEGVLCEQYGVVAANQHEVLSVRTNEQLFPVSFLVHHHDLRAIAPLVKQSATLQVAYTQQNAYTQQSATERQLMFCGNDKKGQQWIAVIDVATTACYPSFDHFAFTQLVEGVKFRDLMRAAKECEIGGKIAVETRKPNVIVVRSLNGKREVALTCDNVAREERVILWILQRWPASGTGDIWIDAGEPARYARCVWQKQGVTFEYIIGAEKCS